MQRPEERQRLSLPILRLCEAVKYTLGGTLTGIYLHGSVAMGNIAAMAFGQYRGPGRCSQTHGRSAYYVLNFCRVLAFLKGSRLFSKKEGGELGDCGIFLMEYRSLLEAALAVYAGTGATPASIRQYPVHHYYRNVEPLTAGKSRYTDRK